MTTTAARATVPWTDLAAVLRGRIVLPADPDYDTVRAVYNGMIDKQPAAIAQCRDVADVIAGVDFARENGLTLAVRGGGHHAAGLGVTDDALVLDLSSMRGTRVDPEQRIVVADGGCTWGDVDHATAAFGLATPSGIVGTTGVAGLTLGGGTGYLTRRYGMTVDNLLAADVVLADGSFVTASEDGHRDLFWALRGGGGNFGVVTSFTFRCHPVGDAGTIIGGPVFYALDDLGEVMRWYRELLPSLPVELSGWIGIMAVPPAPPFPEELWGRTVCGIVWCYTGPGDRADEVLEPIRTFGSPLLVGLQPMPYAALQSVFDPLFRPGCSGTGRATSSGRSATSRSRCTGASPRCCPAVSRRCTSTRSTAPRRRSPRTRRRSPTATEGGPGSSSGSTPIPRTRTRSPAGPATTRRRCTRTPRVARTSTS